MGCYSAIKSRGCRWFWSAIFAIAVLFACGCGQAPTEPDIRNFVVGFDSAFPPYGFKSGGEYKGFDLDLARAVCEKKGWMFIANPINWDSKESDLNSGAIDCIWNGFTMQGRENAYTFSSPYIDNSQVVLVNKGSPVRTLADLAGRIVGVQVDTPVQKALSAGGALEDLGASFKHLVVELNYIQLVNEMKLGSVEAVVVDIGMAKKKMADYPGRFRILDEIVLKETYGIGFKKGNTALRDEVDAVLRELAADGTMARLAAQYGIEPDAIIMK